MHDISPLKQESEVGGMNYPSNSHKSRSEPEEKKVKRVTKGPVVTRKKSLGKRFAETFLGEGSTSVSAYIVNDILIPAAKSTLSDSVGYFFESIRGGVEFLLFGEVRSGRIYRDRGRSYVNYSSISTVRSDRRESRDPSHRNRTRHDFGDIIFTTRIEAEDVRSHLIDLIEDYGTACIADLYSMCDMTSTHVDQKYGWDNLSSAKVKRVPEGFLLLLPRPILLD